MAAVKGLKAPPYPAEGFATGVPSFQQPIRHVIEESRSRHGQRAAESRPAKVTDNPFAYVYTVRGGRLLACHAHNDSAYQVAVMRGEPVWPLPEAWAWTSRPSDDARR